MAKIIRNILAAAMVTLCMASCSENMDTVGGSIVDDNVTIVVDSTFTLEGASVRCPALPARTLTQLLGDITIKGYGHISSTVVTQFMPAAALDTVGVKASDIDSLKLVLSMHRSDLLGDSLAPMGLKIYPLNTLLPTPIYSDFNPQGTYDKTRELSSTIYNISTMGKPDSLAKIPAYSIEMKLPTEFARQLFIAYTDNPASYANPDDFCSQVFKGLYITNSYGSGRIIGAAATSAELYYHRTYYDADRKADTTVYERSPMMAVTPEVVTNNNIDLEIAPEITSRVAQGQAVMMSPAGYDVEITFPTRQLVSAYRNQLKGNKVLNSLSLTLAADTLPTGGVLDMPPYVLLVRKDQRKSFFEQNKMTDNVNSFYAEYNSDKHCYTFSGLRDYLLQYVDAETITDDDVTFEIVPVQVIFESNNTGGYYASTTQVPTGVIPYVLPSLGYIDLAKSKIKLTYCVQSQNF